MDFTKALEADTPRERDRLIRDALDNHDWEDELNESMIHGGFPEGASVVSCSVQDVGGGIIVAVNLSYTESVPTGCKDINRTHDCQSNFTIEIDPEGDYIIQERLEDTQEQTEFYPGDYQ